MCIVFFKLEFDASAATYRLIVAANRDEFSARATRALHVSSSSESADSASGVIGGRDLVRGGMWIGAASSMHSGRFAFLTNVRVPLATLRRDARSRGDVAAQFLQSSVSVDEYLRELCATATQFDPFNAVFGDVRSGQLVFFTNHCAPVRRIESIVVGSNRVYCVTNDATLHSQWPKATAWH
jgi:uncharacterized protein with NRDE domain